MPPPCYVAFLVSVPSIPPDPLVVPPLLAREEPLVHTVRSACVMITNATCLPTSAARREPLLWGVIVPRRPPLLF